MNARDLTQTHIARLIAAGYSIVEDATPGYITVADPIQCSAGGGRKWTETRDTKIRSAAEVAKFIGDRS